MDRYYVGPAEAIEAEFGATSLFGDEFVVFQTTDGVPVCLEGFSTLSAAKAWLADVPKELIECME